MGRVVGDCLGITRGIYLSIPQFFAPSEVTSLALCPNCTCWAGNMENILRELKLQPLVQRFAEERIQPKDIIKLTDDELIRLGVVTIGDRMATNVSV